MGHVRSAYFEWQVKKVISRLSRTRDAQSAYLHTNDAREQKSPDHNKRSASHKHEQSKQYLFDRDFHLFFVIILDKTESFSNKN